MKKHLYIIALLTLFTTAPLHAADTKTAVTSTTSTKITAAELTTKKKAADDALIAYKQAKTADKLAKLQALGDKLIEVRLANLNQVLEIIANRKSLTATQVAALNKSVQADIDNLTALKATIDADTTVEKAKTDVQSIITNYRIFAVFIPKIHISITAQVAQAQLDKLNTLVNKMQLAIDAKKAAGGDTAALTTALTDYKAQLADATKQLAVVATQLDKMAASDVSGSKTALTASREALKVVRADFVAARGDLTVFKDGMEAASTKSTPSASSSTTKTTDQ